jgi:peroxiredoxin
MRISFLSLAFVLAAAVCCQGAVAVKHDNTGGSSSDSYVGRQVVPFTAVAVSGAELSSTDHGGTVLIISLWGINCASCLDEMKALESIYGEFRGQGLKIWAVNTEDIDAGEIVKNLQSREIVVSYDLIPDPGLVITKAFTNWFIPVTVIVDSEGIVQYHKAGFNETEAQQIKAKVGALLAR